MASHPWSSSERRRPR